jgi:hypothetical protein
MIPEQYWYVARRWLWLIVACTLVGGVIALVLLPSFTGSEASYRSKTALGVSRYISLSRIVTAGEANFDEDAIIADYTESFATYAATPHFASSVSDQLSERDIAYSGDIAKSVTITADKSLFRINIEALGSTQAQAEALVDAATAALVTKAQEDEDRIAAGLLLTLEQQRTELVDRIRDLQRELDLSRRGLADRLGYLIDLEYQTAQEELGERTRQREELLLQRASGGPLVPTGPAETVETQGGALAPRDQLILGTVAGLIAGWLLAAYLDRRFGEGRYAQAVVVLPNTALAESPRLSGLLARVSDLESRARALDDPGDPKGGAAV